MTHGSGGWGRGRGDASSYLAVSPGQKRSDGMRSMALVRLGLRRRYGGKVVSVELPLSGSMQSWQSACMRCGPPLGCGLLHMWLSRQG
jgi:hypothetical protein